MIRLTLKTRLILGAVLLLTLGLLLADAPMPGTFAQEVTPEATAAPEATPEATPLPELPFDLLQIEVLARFPHDPDAFTQGLVWVGDGTFYESTGLYAESDLRQVDLTTGEVLRQVAVAPEFFAEGLAQVDDRLIQITWREKTAFVYDANTFEQVGTFSYETDGWGLCYDGERLIMSDGSSTLFFRDPQTFELLGQVDVTVPPDNEPLTNLNELECVDGQVYANIWQTDFIVRIDPATGTVKALASARGLFSAEDRLAYPESDVLNGIAYDPVEDVFYITGKKWPYLYKVRFSTFER